MAPEGPSASAPPPPPAPASVPEPEAAGAPEATQEPEWPPETSWLHVQVLRQEDGLPVPEVEVQAFCQVPGKGVVRKRGPADKDGRIAIPLEPGTHVSVLRALPTMNTAPLLRRVDFAAGEGESFEETLEVPPAGQVEGVVTTDEGEPVSGARVLAWSRERWDLENLPDRPEPDVVGQTDGFGHFRLGGMAQGPFTLDVEVEGMAAIRRAGGVIRHGQAIRDLELLVAPARSVAGVVRDPDGRPVAGAMVVAGRVGRRRRVEPAGTEGVLYYPSSQRIAETAEDGTFLLPAVPEDETWSVLVDHKEFLEGKARLRPGETFLELHLEPGLAIAGRVLGEPGGQPLPGVQLALRGVNQSRAVSDGEGRFRLAGLKPDAGAFLLLWKQGRAASIVWPLPVEAGRDDLEVRLPRGAVLAGRVVDAEGRPVAGASVTLLPPHPVDPATGAEHRGALPERFFDLDHVLTGAAGGFRFQDLRAVRYGLRVEAAGRAVEAAAEAGTEDLEIVLPEGGSSGGG